VAVVETKVVLVVLEVVAVVQVPHSVQTQVLVLAQPIRDTLVEIQTAVRQMPQAQVAVAVQQQVSQLVLQATVAMVALALHQASRVLR
jgi:hypothetical protein